MARPAGAIWMFVGLLCAAGIALPVLISNDFRELTGAAVANLMARSRRPRFAR